VYLQCPSQSYAASGASACRACEFGKYLSNATGDTEAASCTNVSIVHAAKAVCIKKRKRKNAPGNLKCGELALGTRLKRIGVSNCICFFAFLAQPNLACFVIVCMGTAEFVVFQCGLLSMLHIRTTINESEQS
jgi:hypothetical protein